jgi:Subtilase family
MIGLEVDAISVSMSFHADYDPADPLHVATKAATERGISVVVAAGNDGPAADSLQELARDPWVISVGATDGAGVLLPSSSRGSRSVPGPTLVADGTPGGLRYKAVVTFSDGEPVERAYPQEHAGTSFAAPRVANATVFARKTLETCHALWQAWRGGEPRAIIPLPVIGTPAAVDRDFLKAEPGELRRRLQLAEQREVRFPLRQEARQWFEAIAQRLDLESAAEPVADAGAAHRVLRAAARPATGELWEIGAGVVSLDAVGDYLAALTPSRWLDTFLPQVAVEPAVLRRLDADLEPFWSTTDLDILRDVFATGVMLAVEKVR